MNAEMDAFVAKHRSKICKIGGFVLFWIAKPRSNFFFDAGLLIALAAQSLRMWAAGQRGAEAANGPFRLTPFPYEMGSFAALCGFALMSTSFRHWLATLIVWAAAVSTVYWLWPGKISAPNANQWNAAVASNDWSIDQLRRTREIRRFWILWGLVLALRLKLVYRF